MNGWAGLFVALAVMTVIVVVTKLVIVIVVALSVKYVIDRGMLIYMRRDELEQ